MDNVTKKYKDKVGKKAKEIEIEQINKKENLTPEQIKKILNGFAVHCRQLYLELGKELSGR